MDIQKEIDKVKPQAEQLLKEPNKLEKFLKEAEIELEKIPGIGNDLSALVTMIRMIRDYCNGTYKEIPTATIVAIIAALIYVISPVDIIPDELIPVIGFADDVTVIKFAIEMVKTDLNKYKSLKENKMDIKNLLSQMAEFDEMEAPDGMNIAEGVEEENELAENKRRKRIYQAAADAIEKLRDLLEEGVDPATGKLDPETEAWFDKLGEVSEEIYSRAEAFNESLDEANSYTDDMLDRIDMPNKIIESDLGFKIKVEEIDGGVAFAANLTSNQFKPYKPFDRKASKEELAEVIDRCGNAIETKINELEDEIIGIFNERGYQG